MGKKLIVAAILILSLGVWTAGVSAADSPDILNELDSYMKGDKKAVDPAGEGVFWQLADLGFLPAPIGLGLGRIGNFINGELFGRTTDMPWGVVFPGGGPLPRHPSQLYEAILEGFVLFAILRMISGRRHPDGAVFWAFIAGYGLFRFVVENFREPDQQIGFIASVATMGQLLSLPMLVVGGIMLWRLYRGQRPR